jgi:uncharacterized DUF497 family protein
MRFDWDPNKAERNIAKHSVSFEHAILAFDDPFALRAEDLKHSNDLEKRYWHIGESDHGVLIVIFTIRRKKSVEFYRIISARRANRKERYLYEVNKRVSI